MCSIPPPSPSSRADGIGAEPEQVCHFAELRARTSLLEQELYAAERHLMKVGSFVKAAVCPWLAVKEAGSSWWLSLPLEKFPLDRCLALLDSLEALHKAREDTFSDLRDKFSANLFVRNDSLFWALPTTRTLKTYCRSQNSCNCQRLAAQDCCNNELRTVCARRGIDRLLKRDVVQDDALGTRFHETVGMCAALLDIQSAVCVAIDDLIVEPVIEPLPLWDGLVGAPQTSAALALMPKRFRCMCWEWSMRDSIAILLRSRPHSDPAPETWRPRRI
jgi:hypothetical protein